MPDDVKRHGTHDEFVAKCFGDLELARAFCRHYLPVTIPDHIGLEGLELAHRSYVDEELRRSYSDLVYTVPLKEGPGDESGDKAYVYVLIEHKSESDEFTLFQLLRYMVRIWESELGSVAARAGFRLPPIVPLVLHHGRTAFRAPTEFSQLVRRMPGAAELVPKFNCVLIDLTAIRDDELPGEDERLHAVLAVLRSVFDDDVGAVAADVFLRLGAIMDRPATRATALLIMNYLLQSAAKLSDEEFLVATKPVHEKGSDTMSTLIERWKEEGRFEGREEGREEGRIAGYRESIMATISARFAVVPETMRESVNKTADANKLKDLVSFAAICESIDKFCEKLP